MGLLLNIYRKQVFGRFAGGVFPLQMTCNRIFGRLEGVFQNPNFHGPPFRVEKKPPQPRVDGDGVSCVWYMLDRRIYMLKRERLGAFTCWNSEDCIPILFVGNYRTLGHGRPQVQHQHSAFGFVAIYQSRNTQWSKKRCSKRKSTKRPTCCVRSLNWEKNGHNKNGGKMEEEQFQDYTPVN